MVANGPNPTRARLKESDEFQSLMETRDSLKALLDEMREEQAVKEAASLITCPPEEVEYAEELVGSLIIRSLGTVQLVTGYYASARHGSADALRNGEMNSEVVVEVETLAAGDNEYAEKGATAGYFIGKLEMAHGTLYAVPDTGAPVPDDYDRFDFREASPWNMTDTAETLRDKLLDGAFAHKITGGRDNRDD